MTNLEASLRVFRRGEFNASAGAAKERAGMAIPTGTSDLSWMRFSLPSLPKV